MEEAEPRLERIEIDRIDPDPDQPRRDMGDVEPLGADMVQHGQVHPIIVVPDHDRYRIVDGQRRWEAARARGEASVLCLVAEMTPEEVKTTQFSSNYFRKAFNPFENAAEFARLQSAHDWTHAELAAYLGEPRTKITEVLGLLKIPADLRDRLLPVIDTVAKDSLYKIAGAASRDEMDELVALILKGSTTRELRNAVRERKKPSYRPEYNRARKAWNAEVTWPPKDLRNCLLTFSDDRGIRSALWEEYVGHVVPGVTKKHYVPSIRSRTRGHKEALDEKMGAFRRVVLEPLEETVSEALGKLENGETCKKLATPMENAAE